MGKSFDISEVKARSQQRFAAGQLYPAASWKDLGADKQWERSYETQPGIPVDGSNRKLRQFSPFTIRMLPPLVFDNLSTEIFRDAIQRGVQDLSGFVGEIFSSIAGNVGAFGGGADPGEAFPTGGEEERQRSEAGLSGTSQIRATGGFEPLPELGDVAVSQNRTFAQVQQRRLEADLYASTFGTTSRPGTNLTQGNFIALGQELRNDLNAFSEPGFVNRLVAVDVAAQIETMMTIPPLTLLISPESFSINYTKVQQYNQKTRYGYIFQTWGIEQPTISISGKIGAFTAGVNNFAGAVAETTPSPSGVQFASKRDSASYQNLMGLLTFYKNNGYIYDRIENSSAHHFIGALAIEYDGWVYVGHMNSFSWGYDEAETQHGNIGYEIEFTVSQMFDTHEAQGPILPLRAPGPSPSSIDLVTGAGSGVAGPFEPSIDVVQSTLFEDNAPANQQLISPSDVGATARSNPGGAEPGSAFETAATDTGSDTTVRSDFDELGNAQSSGGL